MGRRFSINGDLDESDFAAANKDGAADVPSLRTLGTGATQAAAGNHSHGASGVSDGDYGDVVVSGSATVWEVETIGGVAPGSAAFADTGDFAAASHSHAESDVTGLTADLAAKAPLASPTFTGTPAAPTAAGGTNTTQVATTAFVAAGFQPLDAALTSIAALGTAADKLLYTTGVDTFAEAALTSCGRALLDDASEAYQRITLRTLTVERTEWLFINNSTTITALGCTSPSATGTPSSNAIAKTSAFTMMRRLTYPSTASTAGSSGGLRMGAALCFSLGDASYRGGFLMTFRFGISDAAAVANARMFVGLTSSTSVIGNVEPSSLTNVIGVGCDAGVGNLYMMHNDGALSCTTVDLGANFPTNTRSTDIYELVLYTEPNTASVYYRVTRLNTGDVASGILSTDLPSGSTLLGPQFWRNNGTTALTVKLDIGGWVAEVR